jgi:hypothetical protein
MRHIVGTALGFDGVALRLARRCANAGAAVASIAATESHGASFVARFNVLII